MTTITGFAEFCDDYSTHQLYDWNALEITVVNIACLRCYNPPFAFRMLLSVVCDTATVDK
jgi:hypothetical protein